MTMIRDTSWGASASSSASFAPSSLSHPISICFLRSFAVPPRIRPRLAPLQLPVLLNHYKPSSTLNRKQALGRARTRKHLNPTTFESSKWLGSPRSLDLMSTRKLAAILRIDLNYYSGIRHSKAFSLSHSLSHSLSLPRSGGTKEIGNNVADCWKWSSMKTRTRHLCCSSIDRSLL